MAGAFRIMVSALFAVLQAFPAVGQEDVRKVQLPPEEPKVIEEKCLVCHNRKLIDEAVSQRRNLEKILLQMEKKGVVLTESERRVMGHFWPQKPFKGE